MYTVMTTADLKKYFKDHLVPRSLYNLKGGYHKGRICMEKVKEGWEVYFSEKRDKVGIIHCLTESEACRVMVEEVNKVMQAIYGLKFV